MDLDKAKAYISNKTGIPIELLNGDNIEENVSKAAALLIYRDSYFNEHTISKEGQFAEFVNSSLGMNNGNDTTSVIQELKKELIIESQNKNNEKTDSNIENKSKTSSELFTEWFDMVSPNNNL